MEQALAQPQAQTIYDYIVIGAGVSGMQAADIIASYPHLKLLVLQAQSYIGGRIYSFPLGEVQEAKKHEWVRENSNKVGSVMLDKGAAWLEQTHLVILELCKQFGISLREQYDQGSGILLSDGVVYYQNDLESRPQYVPIFKEAIKKIDDISYEYNKLVYSDLNTPSQQAKEMLSKYDKLHPSKLLNQLIPDPNHKYIKDLFTCFFESSECVSCDDDSMHEVLTKNAKANDLAILKECLGESDYQVSYLFNGGTAMLIKGFIESIEKKIGGPISNVLKLRHQVTTVDNRSKKFTTVMCEAQGKKINFRCKQVVCAVPLAVSKSILFTNISKGKTLVLQNQVQTYCSKAFLVFKKPFWRFDKEGKPYASGDALFSNQYRVSMCHDVTPQNLACGILMFFINGKRYDAWEAEFHGDPQSKKKYLLDLAVKIFKVSEEDKEVFFDQCFFFEQTFANDQFIKSGFQSNTRSGTFTRVMEEGDSLGALYRDENGITFIGSQYSLQYGSYLQGAVRVARKKVYGLIGESDPLAHLHVQPSLPGH